MIPEIKLFFDNLIFCHNDLECFPKFLKPGVIDWVLYSLDQFYYGDTGLVCLYNQLVNQLIGIEYEDSYGF